MKKTDIAMIILIAGVSVMIAYLIASNISFLKVSDLQETVPVIESISSGVDTPDTRLFGKDAINPTQQTIIGNQ